MIPGFELICHHTYAGWDGFAVDLSDHESDGVPEDPSAVEFLSNGAAAGSGAVRFPEQKSRIRVRTTDPAWQPLGGLMIEVTARRGQALTHAQTLVAGHNSFSFFFINDMLCGTFYCPGKSTLPLQGSDGLNSYKDGPGFQPFSVPEGKWVTVGFLHDGLDTMELSVDGHLVARRTQLRAGVPPLGSLGVSVGNEPDRDDHFLNGEIDDLKIWRRDPLIMERQFFSRPVDSAVADCWDRFFKNVTSALDQHPDCRTQMQMLVGEALERLKRTIVAKGPETRERFFRTSKEYLALWSSGRLDAPEMEQLFADWCAWLRLAGISIEKDPAVQALRESDCLKRVLGEIAPLDCDPQVAALMQFILRACAPAGSRADLSRAE